MIGRDIEFMREIGSAAELQPYIKREVMPGDFTGTDLEAYIRNAAQPTGTRSVRPRCATTPRRWSTAVSRSMESRTFESPTAPSCRD